MAAFFRSSKLGLYAGIYGTSLNTALSVLKVRTVFTTLYWLITLDIEQNLPYQEAAATFDSEQSISTEKKQRHVTLDGVSILRCSEKMDFKPNLVSTGTLVTFQQLNNCWDIYVPVVTKGLS